MDHVPGGGRQAAKNFCAVQRLLRMRARLDGVDPVVIRRRVVGGSPLSTLCKIARASFWPVARLIVIVIAIGEGFRQKNSRLHVFGIAS